MRLIYLFSVFILFIGCSCSHNLVPQDPFPNPASLGFHRIEFDVLSKGISKKEIGIANISLIEGKSLDGYSVIIHGIGKGTLSFKSNSCSINFKTGYKGDTQIFLKDLIPFPKKCSIKVISETSPIENVKNNIIETGLIKINLIPRTMLPVDISYYSSNSYPIKKYVYRGQGSFQLDDGYIPSDGKNFYFSIGTLADGGIYRVVGCGRSLEGEFSGNTFYFSLFDIYRKHYLEREDSCDFEIQVIPNSILESYTGRLSVSVYSGTGDKMAPPSFKLVDNKIISYSNSPYTFICSINDTFKIGFSCEINLQKENSVYWIRNISVEGRKSIIGVRGNSIFWTE